MKLKLLSIGLMLVSLSVFAQDRQITGTVTDQSDGSPIAGVNIVVKGTGIGTATDGDGRFTLSVPSTSNTLIFTFLGYATQEVLVAGINSVNVALVLPVPVN